jgi:hypothetical protein
MKKMLLGLVFIILISQVSYAQWLSGSGGIYYNSGTVGVGLTVPTSIFPSSPLFPSAVPKMEIMTGTDTGAYAQLVTIRHNSLSPSTTSRQLGLILKLSNEASGTESNKMGGLLVESSQGYSNSTSLSLVTQNQRRLSIDYLGNVGIGITNPMMIFSGSPLFPSTIPKTEIMTGSDTGAYSQIVTIRHSSFGSSAAPRQLGIIMKLSNEASGTESNKMGGMLVESSLGYANSTSLSLVTQNLRRLFIDFSGNVGIGTTSPTSAFQVGNGIYKASMGSASGPDLYYGTSYLGFNAARSQGPTYNWTMTGDGTNNGGGIVYAGIGGDIYFAPVLSTGGATQTLTDLDVKNKIVFRISGTGTVYAKQINVQLTGWPDYVFKPSYQLLPLKEVKTYIDQNNHLPDMPSAEDVSKEGINLGEMNKRLVKKVEELTLYLIEKDKEDKEQKAVNQEQQKQIDLLIKQVTELSKTKIK